MLYRSDKREGTGGGFLHHEKKVISFYSFMKTIFYCLSKSINSMFII
jgi:hypothetical protein